MGMREEIEKARQAQQEHKQKHDVQLEITPLYASLCSICREMKLCPHVTPDDPPLFYGGRHCDDCDHYWRTGEIRNV